MRFLLLFLGAFLVLGAACDLAPRSSADPARDQWATLAPINKERLAGLRNRQTVVGGRVAALTVPAGVNDPALSQQISDLQGKASELEAAISGFEQVVSQVGGEIETALGRRDKIAARRAVDLAGPRLDQAYAMAGVPFDAIEQRLPEAEAGTSRHLATVAAEEQRLVRIASEGGDLILNVKWQGAALDIADGGTKATFDRLVRLGSACDQLRLTVSAADIAHADDVKKKLVDAGVPADHVASGPDATRQLTAEHLKIVVTAPCLPTVPTAAGAPPPPPAGAGNPPPHVAPGSARPAGQLGMPPPPVPVVERVPAAMPAGGH